MRLRIADHLGWAVAVTADAGHAIVDRRRLALVERGVTPAPIHYDARLVEGQAADLLGEGADEVLRGPRAPLGPPWNRDHRTALAATVIQG